MAGVLRVLRSLVPMALVSVLVATSLLQPAGPAVPAAQAAWPANKLGYGVIESGGREATVRDLGFNWTKLLIYWRNFQPTATTEPDFSSFDPVVDNARKHGLHVLIRIDEPPSWATGSTAHNAPPIDPNTFGRFAGKAAKWFAGRVEAWEIWNEPNTRFEWGGTSPNADKFAEMLRAVYVEIKANDPAAVVVMGGVSTTGGEFEDPNPPPSHVGDLGYISNVARASQRLGRLFDALGSHPYGGPYPPEQDYQLDNSTTPVGLYFRRAELQREAWRRITGESLPVWLTEFGWITDWGLGCVWDSHPTGRTAQKVTPQQQANYLVRAFQYARQHWADWVGPMFVYNLDNAIGTPPNTCDQNIPRYFSLLLPDGSPSLAYQALKAMPKPDADYVATATPTPTSTFTPTPSPTPTRTPAPTQTVIGPGGGTLRSNDADQSTLITVPPGAVSGDTTFSYAFGLPAPPAPLRATRYGFTLSVTSGNTLRPALDEPYTITISYGAGRGTVSEPSLRLYHRTGTGEWTTASVTTTLLTGTQQLIATTETLGAFAVFGTSYQNALPVALNSLTTGW